MPASKRKSSSKSPRGKKAKEEPTEVVDTVSNEVAESNSNGEHIESNGITEPVHSEGVSNQVENEMKAETDTVEPMEPPATAAPESVDESASKVGAAVSYQVKQEETSENPTTDATAESAVGDANSQVTGDATVTSYASQAVDPATSYAAQVAAANYNPVTNAMYASYDMQYNAVTYQNPLTFGAPVSMMQQQSQQIVGNPGEDFSQPPPPPPPPGGEAEAKAEETENKELSITIESDFKIYVAPKRRSMLLTETLLNDMKKALKEGEITILDVQCLRRNHAFLKVETEGDVEKACSTFDDKLIAGVTWAVKRRIGRAELHMVSFKPSNQHFRVDDDMCQEVMKHVKISGFHVLRHYATQDSKEILVGLETEEEQQEMVKKLNKCMIGHVEYSVTVKEDIVTENPNDPEAEPFLFASIRGDDSKHFDGTLVACIKKLLSDESIELKRSNVTANGRFAFFFLEKWDDATKFVEKYDNKIINDSPLHFEKGQPKSQREMRPRFRGRGGGYYNSSPRGRGGYNDGGYSRPPRGGGGGYYGASDPYGRAQPAAGAYYQGAYSAAPAQYGYAQYGYSTAYTAGYDARSAGSYYGYSYPTQAPRGAYGW